MDLFLIRHGETVDNVAGVYAGVTDSALTNHGVEQTKRLGQHFASNNIIFTHIFASPLSRAFKTAQAIQACQPAGPAPRKDIIDIRKVHELIEQDFGYYERKPFHARSDPNKSGRDAHREQHKNDAGFVDVESKESMNRRADAFLDEHLIPLFAPKHEHSRRVVAVVSHGILLSHLWRRLLLRLPEKSLTIAPEVSAVKGTIVLQHLGGWSNTGYLEIAMNKLDVAESHEAKDALVSASSPVVPAKPNTNAPTEGTRATYESLSGDVSCSVLDVAGSMPPDTNAPSQVKPAGADVEAAVERPTSAAAAVSRLLTHWTTLIVAIDRKDHLTGLKRQRGGIGRSAHDDKQAKLDGFFKRQRMS